MYKIAVSIIVIATLLIIGEFVSHNKAPTVIMNEKDTIKKDFNENEVYFTLVKEYCLAYPDIASKGITGANSNDPEVDKALKVIFEELDYRLIQLGNGTKEERSYIKFKKNTASDQEEYSLLYSSGILGENCEEITSNWYVQWGFLT